MSLLVLVLPCAFTKLMVEAEPETPVANVKLKLELSVAMLSPSVALNVRANVPSVAPLSDDNGRIVKTDES